MPNKECDKAKKKQIKKAMALCPYALSRPAPLPLCFTGILDTVLIGLKVRAPYTDRAIVGARR
jgi:hypothetical protein